MKLVSSPDQKSIEALIKNLLILATYSLSNLWPWGEIYTHTDTHAHTHTHTYIGNEKTSHSTANGCE